MSKNNAAARTEADPVLQQNLDYQAPGRTVGIVVMIGLIAFTAAFMTYQSTRLDGTSKQSDMPDGLSQSSERFDAAHFSLPRDERWGFVAIPAGEFTMGSNPLRDRMAYENERWSSTQRQGRVDLPTFFIGRYEVTNAQFAAYLKETNGSMLAQFTERLAMDSQSTAVLEQPVTGITLPQMLGYARWLDAQLRLSAETPTELRELLDADGRVVLPNEAEWEKAARSEDGRTFPWGMQPSESYANFGGSALMPVGSIDCNTCSYGLADMAGNAWELTRSPLQDYPFSLDQAPEALLSLDSLWVMRGGSFQDGMNNVRTAVRGAVDPSVRNATIGFRVAISTLP